jgi:hypothetical protein
MKNPNPERQAQEARRVKEAKRRARDLRQHIVVPEVRRGRKILRPKEAWERLGCGHDRFYVDYVRTGLVKLITLGGRAKGVPEDEIDALIAAMVEQRDAATA